MRKYIAQRTEQDADEVTNGKDEEGSRIYRGEDYPDDLWG